MLVIVASPSFGMHMQRVAHACLPPASLGNLATSATSADMTSVCMDEHFQHMPKDVRKSRIIFEAAFKLIPDTPFMVKPLLEVIDIWV